MLLEKNLETARVRIGPYLYLIEENTKQFTDPNNLVALDVMTRICLRVMTRVVAGTELSRDESFLSATGTYLGGNFLTGFIMLKMPFGSQIRDIVAWPLWKYHQTFNQQRVLNIIKPVVAKRIQDHENGTLDSKRFDAVTCSLKLLDDYPFDSSSKYTPVHTLSHETLQLIWAAAQSPAMSVTAILFKLLEEPQYMEPLRSEARAAVEKHGWGDPIFNELSKLDSFIRETHRMYPAFSRKARTKSSLSASLFVLIMSSQRDTLRERRTLYLLRWLDYPCRHAHRLSGRGHSVRPRCHRRPRCLRWLPIRQARSK